ncbi:hypothetical protein BDN71DRAFT_845706 [Pleurotus eryngii]|uniref:Uncharacterized protein n=1 Tax=Pleurotus eryngii TaxID=5323 RepID=A0A9P6A6U0_PLEER|nr:hypothetical protein BDN71DRAFT_845706 [Pleurotus eryngii]
MALARPLHVKYLGSSNLLLSVHALLKPNLGQMLHHIGSHDGESECSQGFLRRLLCDTHIAQFYVEHRWHSLMHLTILWLIPALRAALSEAKHGLKHGGKKEEDSKDAIEEPPATTSSPSNTTTVISTVPPSSSSSGATSTSLPFRWDSPSNTSTCQSTIFTWRVSDSRTAPMTVTITNERVAQQEPGLPPPNTTMPLPLLHIQSTKLPLRVHSSRTGHWWMSPWGGMLL